MRLEYVKFATAKEKPLIIKTDFMLWAFLLFMCIHNLGLYAFAYSCGKSTMNQDIAKHAQLNLETAHTRTYINHLCYVAELLVRPKS